MANRKKIKGSPKGWTRKTYDAGVSISEPSKIVGEEGSYGNPRPLGGGPLLTIGKKIPKGANKNYRRK